MDKGMQFKQEVDTHLDTIKLSEQMKGRIQAACHESKQTNVPIRMKPYRYKKAFATTMLILVCSGSLMAMDYKLGLGLFFDQETMNHIANQVQHIDKYDENQKVRMEIGEAINQAYGAVMTVDFINQGDKPWPKDVTAGRIEVNLDNDYAHSELSQGILSEDGKRLSYCVNIVAIPKILNGTHIEVNTKNLVQRQTIERDVQIPLKACLTTKVKSTEYRQETVKQIFKAQDEMEQKKVTLDEAYPSVSLVGIGILEGDGEKEKKGIILQIENADKPTECDELSDAYFEGKITQVIDTRTGQKYEKDYFIGADHSLVTYFPGIKEEQIPYLEAIKVVYEHQEVVAEGTWQTGFEIEENKNIIKWQPNLEIQKGENIISIEEVYLTTAGIQVKERTVNSKTQAFLGDYNSNWLDISLINDKGETIPLNFTTLRAVEDSDGNIIDYVLDFNTISMDSNGELREEWKLLDVASVKKVVINGHELEKK